MKRFLTAMLGLVFLNNCEASEVPDPCEAWSLAQYAIRVYADGVPDSLGCCSEVPPAVYSVESVEKNENGFYAEVFFGGEDGNEVVIAFRGSQEAMDFIDDGDQAINGNNKQFAAALDYFNRVNYVLDHCYSNVTKRTIVGHSLGGALAQHIAQSTTPSSQYQVVTFNPAALLVYDDPSEYTPVYNFVHGNDLLATVVNPFLEALEEIDGGISSGYIGTDIILGEQKGGLGEEFDSACEKLNLSREDISALNAVFPTLKAIANLIDGEMLKGVTGLPNLSESVSAINSLLEEFRDERYAKVLSEIDLNLGEKYKNFISSVDEMLEMYTSYLKEVGSTLILDSVGSVLFPGFGLFSSKPVLAPYVEEAVSNALIALGEFAQALHGSKVLNDIGVQLEQKTYAHFDVNELRINPSRYTENYEEFEKNRKSVELKFKEDNFMGMLQKQCKDDLAWDAEGSLGFVKAPDFEGSPGQEDPDLSDPDEGWGQTHCSLDNESMLDAWRNPAMNTKIEKIFKNRFDEIDKGTLGDGLQCAYFVNRSTCVDGKSRVWTSNHFKDSASDKWKLVKEGYCSPVPGDILVAQYEPNKDGTNAGYVYGHVAIVLAYDKETGTVWVADANAKGHENFDTRSITKAKLSEFRRYGFSHSEFSSEMKEAICKVLLDDPYWTPSDGESISNGGSGPDEKTPNSENGQDNTGGTPDPDTDVDDPNPVVVDDEECTIYPDDDEEDNTFGSTIDYGESYKSGDYQKKFYKKLINQ